MRKNYFLKITLTVFTLLLYTIGSIRAQTQPPKYGKISQEELAMTSCPIDSGANAAILYDIGYSYFKNKDEDFEIVHERRCRIKIFNKAGLDAATVIIPYYTAPGAHEQVSAIRASTYVLENGKMHEYKLDSKSIFDEKASSKYRQIKFTLPNVKDGAVIEFAYSLTSSDIITFTPWNFQSTYPTLWSEFRARIPEYFVYTSQSQGYTPFFINEKTQASERFTINYKGESTLLNQRTGAGIYTLEPTCDIYHWVQKDIKAFEDDDFISSREDHLAKIKFQLQGYHFPQQAYQPVLNNWKKINEAIYKSEEFSSALRCPAPTKEKVKLLCANITTTNDKIIAINSYLKKEVKWNGNLSIWPGNTPRQIIEKKTGNSAEINLLLVALLREAGLSADPVLISSRRHGKVNTLYPMLSNFNDVIAAVKTDSTFTLVDATDPNCSALLLPEYCLNGEGHTISKNGDGEWIQLENDNLRNKTNIIMNLKCEQGKIKGQAMYSAADYAATRSRNQLASAGSDMKFIKSILSDQSINVSNLKHTPDDNPEKPLRISFDFEVGEVGPNEERIYISPMLCAQKTHSAFKAKERKYAMSFNSLSSESLIWTMDIPPGYEVEELPKPIRLNMSDGAATMHYLIGSNGSILQLNFNMSINRKTFSPEEYPDLRSFYATLANKQSEQIVLKRIAH